MREWLAPGHQLTGPVAVVEADSAVRIDTGELMSVHEDGTLEIEW
jgi:hypothetical protein